MGHLLQDALSRFEIDLVLAKRAEIVSGDSLRENESISNFNAVSIPERRTPARYSQKQAIVEKWGQRDQFPSW